MEKFSDKVINIRKAELCDVDSLMPIFNEARGTIAKLGIDQWQDGYPQREVIEWSTENSYTYCVEITDESGNKNICATFALHHDGEPLYDKIIDGNWINDAEKSDMLENVKYLAIHRVAISVACRGSGISTKIIDFAADFAKKHNKTSLRIDTHEGNVVMRKMLSKHGFTHCGTIFLANGHSRVAYEKFI